VLSLAAPTGFRLEYQYDLATFAGRVRTSAATLNYDRNAHELYVVGYGQVRVFNAAGMEVFRFGDDEALGIVYGVAALENGDLLVVSYRDSKPGLLRCNFRGEVVERVELTGVPEALKGFGPNAIAYQGGRVYLADLMGMRVVVVDTAGRYFASYDLAELAGLAGTREDAGMNGFGVDRDGSMLFTVAAGFRAYVVSLAGEVRFFGKPGSAPGTFGVVAGIGSDASGRYYVADTLKSAVMVFDRDFTFLGQVGTRGTKPGQLVAPTSLAVADNRVFVSQQGNRGVTVYQVRDE
jgi:sugar lactone lactonase YvrE